VVTARFSRMRSLLLCLAAYAAAGIAAIAVARLLRGSSPVWSAAAADLAATIVVFAFSLGLDNSSMYDPYWSVAPAVIAPAWLLTLGGGGLSFRQAALLLLVLVWAARLTGNLLRRWHGLSDEDWRYANYRRLGAGYWPVSFLGFHLMPTVLVFVGCVPISFALSPTGRPLGLFDAAAVIITGAAIIIEAVADQQLRRFLTSPRTPGGILHAGLWSLSRHPNYFGEVLFWWGIWLFGIAAEPSSWWTIAGPAAITALFAGISVPMMDRHMLARHPGYAEHIARRSGLIPWPARRGT
jgi:steroid 5-alpha reductase family enzyme